MKRDKFLQKALDEMRLYYNNEDHEFALNNVSDINFLIKNHKAKILDFQNHLQETSEAIEQLKNEINTLESLEHQCKVEAYKELNKNRDIDIF